MSTKLERILAARDAEAERLRARIAELEEQLAQYRHECSSCRTVQLCQPTGYEWEWECADDDACAARVAALPQLRRAPHPDRWGLSETFKQLYEEKLLENARRELPFRHTFARIDLDGADDE
jgi:cell division septum initiation protein DivIVA